MRPDGEPPSTREVVVGSWNTPHAHVVLANGLSTDHTLPWDPSDNWRARTTPQRTVGVGVKGETRRTHPTNHPRWLVGFEPSLGAGPIGGMRYSSRASAASTRGKGFRGIPTVCSTHAHGQWSHTRRTRLWIYRQHSTARDSPTGACGVRLEEL
jgi:hypothetical protein